MRAEVIVVGCECVRNGRRCVRGVQEWIWVFTRAVTAWGTEEEDRRGKGVEICFWVAEEL